MFVNVNNGERPDFGETAKTTTRRVLQRYFDYVDILYLQYLPITKLFKLHIFRIIHQKCYIHIQITRRIRSIVDKSLVHCHRGCEFEPRHSTMLFYFFLIYFFINYLLSRGI